MCTLEGVRGELERRISLTIEQWILRVGKHGVTRAVVRCSTFVDWLLISAGNYRLKVVVEFAKLNSRGTDE